MAAARSARPLPPAAPAPRPAPPPNPRPPTPTPPAAPTTRPPKVSLPSFDAGLPAYYILALSEASSNLSRYDGVRYGLRAGDGSGLKEMYDATRGAGLGPEVKRRILMGTYALSAGYYDAYYNRAQKVGGRGGWEGARRLGRGAGVRKGHVQWAFLLRLPRLARSSV
jgi:hypothetical protein